MREGPRDLRKEEKKIGLMELLRTVSDFRVNRTMKASVTHLKFSEQGRMKKQAHKHVALGVAVADHVMWRLMRERRLFALHHED